MTSEGNSALLPANVDQQPPLQLGLMNFQLYNKSRISMFSFGFASGNIEILGKQNWLFPSGPVIKGLQKP